MLSSLHAKSPSRLVYNFLSYQSTRLLLCYANHRLKQVCCLALDVIIFCLTKVACDVIVSLGGVARRVGWRAGWGGGPGRVAGRVGWRAGWGGGPGGRRGMDLRSKECSGVNIVT